MLQHEELLVQQNFGETRENRRQSIDILRHWAEKNPRINRMRLDSKWLLKFLRIKKFSIPMTQEAIERSLMIYYYNFDGFEINKDLDIREKKVQQLLDAG